VRAALGFLPLAVYLGVILYGCAAASHASNTAEATQYALELAQCRESAKADGGWPAYETCACHVDARHGLDASAGCP
jgi:hypothetical protein